MIRVGLVPGDGIGPEVVREARRVLEAVGAAGLAELSFREFPHGADHFLATGETLGDEAFATLPARWAELTPPFEAAAWIGIVSGSRVKLEVRHRSDPGPKGQSASDFLILSGQLPTPRVPTGFRVRQRNLALRSSDRHHRAFTRSRREPRWSGSSKSRPPCSG